MRRLVLTSVAAALGAALLAPVAGGGHVDAVRDARRGITRALADGRLPAAEATRYRAVLRRAGKAVHSLPAPRGATLAAVLADVAALASHYEAPRALALFAMLEANVEYLSAHGVPPGGKDVEDAEGVVYRAFTGRGLQFHPLANFAKLNEHLAFGRYEEAARLAAALLARGVPKGGGLVWEYYFPFDSGHPPWTSGMAQAVAAQALARAGDRLGDPVLMEAGRRAFRAVLAGRLLQLPGGAWIRQYSFSRLVVLNAQLQALLSLLDYAELAGDGAAQAVADRLAEATLALLPSFDTGYWTRYSPARESPLGYHRYVVSLLERLGKRTQEAIWFQTAERFEEYLLQPPAFELGAPAPPLVVRSGRKPGGLRAEIRFWLSKLATVTLEVGGERRSLRLSAGWHTFVWKPGRRRPGLYAVRLTAIDLAGNRAEVELLPIALLENPSAARG